MEYEDSPKCQIQRRKLVEAIQSKGISDARVLTAIGRIPRHLFMPESLRNKAYMDNAFPIGNEQTISQPYTVAYQTWLLNVEPGGLLVAPVGRPGKQRMVRITKGTDDTITEEQFDHFAFVPMLPGIHNPPEGGASP